MCRMVYLGSSRPLRRIPWDPAAPALHVVEVGPDVETAVRAALGTPFVAYAGAHEGCGCGFQIGEWAWDDDEEEERALSRAALTALAAYLRTELATEPRIRVLACWAGDEGKEPGHRRELSPDDLLRDDFYFLDRERSVFRALSP